MRQASASARDTPWRDGEVGGRSDEPAAERSGPSAQLEEGDPFGVRQGQTRPLEEGR